MKPLTGVLPLYKPKGMTSHDCVYKIRKLFGTKKVGHTGTLDPDVDGVLPICIGRATKIVQYLINDGKTYEGIISLGTATTTEDASGDIIAEKPVDEAWHHTQIEEVFNRFTGVIEQTPPMYSAIKVNGKKLYEYARAGIAVERPTRKITIYRLELPSNDDTFTDHIPFVVDCSKGTYIRTLAVDIGEALGYPAHMASLTRTRSGQFHLKDCYTFEDIEKALENGDGHKVLKDIGTALHQIQDWTVDEDIEQKIRNGMVLPIPENFQNELLAVYNKFGDCLAIYRKHATKPGMMKPDTVIAIRDEL